MSIRTFLARPLPQPKSTVGTRLLAVGLGVLSAFLQSQRQAEVNRRLDLLERHAFSEAERNYLRNPQLQRIVDDARANPQNRVSGSERRHRR